MTTVFLSGSRAISRLNDAIRSRICNMTDQDFEIVLGDANGADKALQTILAETAYPKVSVYCAGGKCRNNVGNWRVQSVEVPSSLKGRDFYTQKDLKMADAADYGFVLWDGKSSGSINNIFALLKRNKKIVVYLSKTKEFFTIGRPDQLNRLLDACDADDYRSIDKKIDLNKTIRELGEGQQGAFDV